MARSCLVLVFVAGCGFSLPLGGDDQIPDGRPISIVDDAPGDFTGSTFEATITERGTIEPDAFVLSGLHVRAFSSTFDADDTYMEALATATNQLGEGYRQVPFRFDSAGSDHPHGVGISGGAFSLFYDGEIYLPAGMIDIEVDADDHCIVQLQLDGATWTDEMRDAYSTANPITRFDVPAEGWYPIRAAFVQSYGGSWFDIHVTPVGGTRTHVDGTHTRARVTSAQGLLVDAFQLRAMGRALGSTAVAKVDHDFGYGAPPFDLGIPSSDFTLRYLGQIRIDEPGAYTFYASSSTGGGNGGDLWRVWIDGVAIAGPWTAGRLPMATVDLEPGWHDFGVDFGDDDNDARIQARMSGPGIPDGPIDPARLRPAVATGLTSVFIDLANKTNIKDATASGPTETTVDISVTGTAGAKVVSVDWGFGVEFSRMTDLSARRVDCFTQDTQVPLGANAGYYYFANDTSCANSDLPLAWKYIVTDSVTGGIAGNVWNPLVAVTYRGGEVAPPFAKQAVFTSSVRETPNAIGFGRVSLDADLRGGGATLEIRTASSEAALDAASWVAVADDAVPAVEPGTVLQYRVTLETGGWELVSVDRVEIVYIVPE
ncbi:MAG: hypothetical protein AB7T06_27160 [Kofleriaceae bacterium]